MINNESLTELIKLIMFVLPSGFVAGLITGLFMKLIGTSIKKLIAIMK